MKWRETEMANANNVVSLLGRLTATPEVKTFRNKNGEDFKACKFSLAVNRDKETTDFLECSSLGRTADFIGRYFNKGDGISIQGSLQTYEYEKDGTKRKGTQVFVESVGFVPAKKEKPEEPVSEAPVVVDDEDLPF